MTSLSTQVSRPAKILRIEVVVDVCVKIQVQRFIYCSKKIVLRELSLTE